MPNKFLKQEDAVDGKTIKTLAEYINKLKQDNADYFRDYQHNQFDTNGVEVNHIETFWPPNEHSNS